MRRFSYSGIGVVAVLAAALAAPRVAWASVVGQMLADEVSANNYGHYMEDLLYTYLGDNRGFGPEHDLARDNIEGELQSFGLAVQLEPFTYLSNTYYNVVATQTGAVHPNEYYVVCAHFDSVNNPGADDNATGVAAVMEVARVMSMHETEYTIKFILWDREEQGLVGSNAYVSGHSGDTIRGVLNFDMIGHNNHGTLPYEVEIYGRTSSTTFMNAWAGAINTYCTQLDSSFVFTNSALSDHAPFAAAGYQACSTIEWNYILNTNYHQPTDALDLAPGYINYSMTSESCRAAVGYLADNAVVVLPPVPGDVDGDGDVDNRDYRALTLCLGGPASTSPPSGCQTATFAICDFNGDGRVDLADFALFAMFIAG